MKLAIAIPTLNEKDNIKPLVVSIFEECKNTKNYTFTILFIDDQSSDGTLKVIKRMAKIFNYPDFKIIYISRKPNNGLAGAYKEGITSLLNSDYDYIIQMDADLSHNPKYLRNFIVTSKNHINFVLGSRYIVGGSTPDWSTHRRLLSVLGNYYSRLLLGNKITDYTGGFNMYSSNLLRKINLDTIKSTGYGFLIELKHKATLNTSSIFEFPIIFSDRVNGKSKIPKNIILKNLVLVLRLRFFKD
ncbi:MAG: polyprenol monophosphomannose synthase [bacterium]